MSKLNSECAWLQDWLIKLLTKVLISVIDKFCL